MLSFGERVLLAAVAELGGKTYGHSGQNTTDCSRAVGGVLVSLYGDTARSIWPELMVMDASQPFSPVEACVRVGIGESCSTPIPGRWHVVQGWRKLDHRGWVPHPSPSPNGHVFLYYAPLLVSSGSGILVNANTSRPWSRSVTFGEAVGPYRAGIELCALKEPT